MKGYKAFDKDFKCHNMQYKVGETYTHEGEIKLCLSGFHFCKNIADCFIYYPGRDVRFAEVEALGDVIESDDDSKCVTNKIFIIEEITYEKAVGLSNAGNWNTGNSNTGNRNAGGWNAGNWNTGGRNAGDWNTGDWNAGDWNAGDENTGDSNIGDGNTGDSNIGDGNTGNSNTGDMNAGDWNAGDWNVGNENVGNSNIGDGNTGNSNTGDGNTGDMNTGDWNTGNWNTGDCNTGNRNTGDWNTASFETGCFCTKTDTIRMFNKISDITYDEWRNSRAYKLLVTAPKLIVEWISEEEMTDEEKAYNPTYNITHGYLKVTDMAHARQEWWDGLSETEMEEVTSLPNFDAEIFYKCTGIKISEVK